ncbi:hypothetical protein LJC35_00340 [Parabacteroides sp. OttesenSCG-928-N08]|nr:hypothetical protein [Parabacteroides sp. OttesenSCG-928-N08]
MNTYGLTTASVIDAVKQGFEKIGEMYKNSNGEERRLIIKVLAALGGFVTFIKYLVKL